MSQLMRFEGKDGSFMLIETTQPQSDVGLMSDESGLVKATTRLEDSLGSIRGAAVALLCTVKEMKASDDRIRLDEVSLQVGLSFGMEGGVIVAKGSARAEATVTLSWKASHRD